DAAVIVIEERGEVRGQIVLIARLERAHDAEIDRRITWMLRIIEQHEDVSWVHVRVEEIVAERLREEDLDAILRKPFDVRAPALELLHIVDEHAAYALHYHHILAAVIPIDFRHIQLHRSCEVAANLRSICRLAHEVELIEDRLLVLT